MRINVVSQASRNFSSCACALGRGAGEGKEKYVWALLPGFPVRVVCNLWAITPSVLGNVATAYRLTFAFLCERVTCDSCRIQRQSVGSVRRPIGAIPIRSLPMPSSYAHWIFTAREGNVYSVARSRSLSSRPLPLAIVVSVTFYTQRLRNPFMLRGTRDRAQISRAAI